MDDDHFESAHADTVADQTISSLSSYAQADSQNKKRKTEKGDESNKKPKVHENRAIYVTNLPLDTNEIEIEEQFKKYGIIDQGADGGKRIKMYTDDKGNFNGEALIVYFKKESISLAVRMMDDYWFRLSEQNHGTIRVREADFSFKKNKDGDEIVSKLTRKDKKASERARADLNRKLAEWSDNEEEVAKAFAPKKNKWAKIVILKHAFTLGELDEDEEEYFNIKDEIREEAEKHGSVTNVTLFDLEKEGIMTVRFSDFDAAESFCTKSNGRFFASQKLEARLADDKPKFKKSDRGQQQQQQEEDDSEDEERVG